MKRLLPDVMIAIWMPFATLFTQPVWRHLQVLWRGAVLCRRPRTVASVLRVMGLGRERLSVMAALRDVLPQLRAFLLQPPANRGEIRRPIRLRRNRGQRPRRFQPGPLRRHRLEILQQQQIPQHLQALHDLAGIPRRNRRAGFVAAVI